MNRNAAIRLLLVEHDAVTNEYGTSPEAEAEWDAALDALGIPLEHRVAAMSDPDANLD